jgi:hypothetical protein
VAASFLPLKKIMFSNDHLCAPGQPAHIAAPQKPAADPDAPGTLEFGRCVIVRYTAVPPRSMHALKLAKTVKRISTLQAIEQWFSGHREKLSEEFSERIRLEGDDRQKKTLINSRRALFSHKRVDEQAPAFVAFIDASSLLRRWMRLEKTVARIAAGANVGFDSEVADASSVLNRIIKRRSIARGLLFSNHQIYEQYRKYVAGEFVAGTKETRRTEQTLYRYLTRAACKHSPFGAFMYSYAHIAADDQVANGVDRQSRRLSRKVTLNMAVLATIADKVSGNLDQSDRSMLKPNQSSIAVDGELYLFKKRPSESPLRLFHVPTEKTLVLRGARGLQTAVAAAFAGNDAMRRSDLASKLAALGATDPVARMQQLYDHGLLEAAAPIGHGDMDPLARISELAQAGAAPAMAAVETLQAKFDAFRMGGRQDESAKLGGLRDAMTSLLNEAGLSDRIDPRAPLVFESYGGAAPQRFPRQRIPAGLGDDLAMVVQEAAELDAGVMLLQQFTALAMAGATRMPVLEFIFKQSKTIPHLLSAADRIRDPADIPAMLEQLLPEMKIPPVPAPGGRRRGWYSCHMQSYRQGGRTRYVINRLEQSAGRAAMRYVSTVAPESGRDPVIHALAQTFDGGPSAQACEVFTGFDFDANVRPAVLAQRLDYEGRFPAAQDSAPLAGNDTLMLRDLALVKVGHDIQVVGKDGKQLSFFDFGQLSPMFYPRPLRYLLGLAKPAYSIDLKNPCAGEAPATITHYPRREIGDITVRRACWSIPVAELPRLTAPHLSLSNLTNVIRWLRTNGMPTHFFVRASSDQRWMEKVFSGDKSVNIKERKNEFVDVETGVGLSVFLRICEAAESHIFISEALPSPMHSDKKGAGTDRPAEYCFDFQY